MSKWRPLYFLNFDYKLLAKEIAERMKLFFPTLKDSYQIKYVVGGIIGENLRLIADIILLTTLKNYQGLL